MCELLGLHEARSDVVGLVDGVDEDSTVADTAGSGYPHDDVQDLFNAIVVCNDL